MPVTEGQKQKLIASMPNGLLDLIGIIARAVLQEQPEKIYLFVAQKLEKDLEDRSIEEETEKARETEMPRDETNEPSEAAKEKEKNEKHETTEETEKEITSADSPHPALHKTESVTDLPEEIEEEESGKHSPEVQNFTDEQKISHLKTPEKVDSAPVQTKTKDIVVPHPVESDRVTGRAIHSQEDVEGRMSTDEENPLHEALCTEKKNPVTNDMASDHSDEDEKVECATEDSVKATLSEQYSDISEQHTVEATPMASHETVDEDTDKSKEAEGEEHKQADDSSSSVMEPRSNVTMVGETKEESAQLESQEAVASEAEAENQKEPVQLESQEAVASEPEAENQESEAEKNDEDENERVTEEFVDTCISDIQDVSNSSDESDKANKTDDEKLEIRVGSHGQLEQSMAEACKVQNSDASKSHDVLIQSASGATRHSSKGSLQHASTDVLADDEQKAAEPICCRCSATTQEKSENALSNQQAIVPEDRDYVSPDYLADDEHSCEETASSTKFEDLSVARQASGDVLADDSYTPNYTQTEEQVKSQNSIAQSASMVASQPSADALGDEAQREEDSQKQDVLSQPSSEGSNQPADDSEIILGAQKPAVEEQSSSSDEENPKSPGTPEEEHKAQENRSEHLEASQANTPNVSRCTSDAHPEHEFYF